MAGLQLGEAADEADWRALVDKGLRGGPWEQLVGRTADGIELKPLYREPDIATSSDQAGFPGAAPFVRGGAGWAIRQSFSHPDPAVTNHEILADLAGGVGGIELVLGDEGCAIASAADLDVALAGVILEAAPVSLDGATLAHARLLRDKLKGVAAAGTAFNLDPIGALMRDGVLGDVAEAAHFAAEVRTALPAAAALRVDARPVHEAGGTEAQEIAAALGCGIFYLRALTEAGLSAEAAANSLLFTFSVGPDVLIETAKFRALRLCWARVLEASGVGAPARGARVHAITSRAMMTRVDAHTNILRITCAAFAASIAGAQAITTLPFTDALGLPTAFARRVARNTQHVLLEECRLGHVADPAGGAWFVEKLTCDLAALAWTKMQAIEARGGIVAALTSGALQKEIAGARAKREDDIARRKIAITGVTDFPLLGQKAPDFGPRTFSSASVGLKTSGPNSLTPIRWAAPFEALRERAEGKAANVFFATLGALAEFSPRAQFARTLFAVGGVASVGEEDAHSSREAMIDGFEQSGARVVAICGADAACADHAENAAQRLKAAGASWVVLAGKPGEREAGLRAAGVDQFVYTGQNALAELETLHAALGLAP